MMASWHYSVNAGGGHGGGQGGQSVCGGGGRGSQSGEASGVSPGANLKRRKDEMVELIYNANRYVN